jgi:hypothetical protein
MATQVTIKIKNAAIRDLLRSAAVRADLERRAEAIANAAGEGMEVDSDLGNKRARASVRTASVKAVMAESEHRALTKAIDAGRG